MDPLFVGAVTGGAVLFLGLSMGRSSRSWFFASCIAVASALAGLKFGFISTVAPLSGYPIEQLWLILAWIEFAYLISISGLVPKGNLGLLAFFGGALVSDLGATALIAPFAGSTKNRGRVALTASAGAMLTIGGTQSSLLFSDVQINPFIAVALALLVWPKGSAMRDPQKEMVANTVGNKSTRLIIPACVVALVLMQTDLPAFWIISGLDIALLFIIGPKRVKTPWRKEIYIVALATIAAVAVSTGALEQLRLGSSLLLDLYPDIGAGGVAIGAGLLSVIGGEGASSIVLSQTFVDTAYASSTQIQSSAQLGLAIGGIAPLIVAGALRVSFLLFSAQFALMVLLSLSMGA